MVDETRQTPSVRPLLLTVLRPLYALAILATVVNFLGRGLVPALHGWRVGLSRFIDGADLAAEFLAQLTVVFSIVSLFALVFQLTRMRLPLLSKIAVVGGALITLTLCIAAIGFPRTPIWFHAVIGTAATLVALVCSIDVVMRERFGGGIIIATGVASVVRGVGSYMAESAAAERRTLDAMRSAFDVAYVCATVATGFVIVAVVLGAVWFVRLDRRKAPAIVATAAGLALAIALQTRGLPGADDSSASVLLRSIGQHLVTRPYGAGSTFLPAVVAGAGALLALGIAIGATPRRHRALGSAIGLLLIVGASAEVPLLALALMIGAVGMCIDRRDQEGVFAALEAGENERVARRNPPSTPLHAPPENSPVPETADPRAEPGWVDATDRQSFAPRESTRNGHRPRMAVGERGDEVSTQETIENDETLWRAKGSTR